MGPRRNTCSLSKSKLSAQFTDRAISCTMQAKAQGYKTFFMLNSTEHEISTDHKIENGEK